MTAAQALLVWGPRPGTDIARPKLRTDLIDRGPGRAGCDKPEGYSQLAVGDEAGSAASPSIHRLMTLVSTKGATIPPCSDDQCATPSGS